MSGEYAAGFKRVLDAWDAAFVEGDIDAFSGLVADDVQLMWHYRETITGKENVVVAFGRVFFLIDTSAWKARPSHR
jgi:ketosteroid isomerase-like protein